MARIPMSISATSFLLYSSDIFVRLFLIKALRAPFSASSIRKYRFSLSWNAACSFMIWVTPPSLFKQSRSMKTLAEKLARPDILILRIILTANSSPLSFFLT